MYYVELVWNREFDWVTWKSFYSIKEAITEAKMMENSGDGASVKKTRVCLDGKVVWQYGKLVT
jgi:hypothetical protein